MKKIKELRTKKGLLQEDVSKKIKRTRSYVSYLEKDATHLLPDIEKDLLELFSVSKVDLWGIDILKFIPDSKEEWEKMIDILIEEKEKRYKL